MPLQIAPRTAPESFDHLAVLVAGGAQNPRRRRAPDLEPGCGAQHRRQGELMAELTDSLDNLAKHFDALAKAGFERANTREREPHHCWKRLYDSGERDAVNHPAPEKVAVIPDSVGEECRREILGLSQAILAGDDEVISQERLPRLRPRSAGDTW